MAEYRELPMIHAALYRSINSSAGVHGIPKTYRMGKGHVKFFYNKGLYLFNRYQNLVNELKIRSYELDPNRSCEFYLFEQNNYMNDWIPSAQDKRINITRLLEKVEMKPQFYKLYGDCLNPKEYRELLAEYGELL